MAQGRYLKLEDEPDASAEARQKLAEAIAAHLVQQTTVAERAARIVDLEPRVWEAEAAAEAAALNVETVRQAHIDRISYPSRPEPVMTVREAREAAADATDHASTLRSALETARGDQRAEPVEFTGRQVTLAVALVAASDPAVRAACAHYLEVKRQFSEAWSVVRFLSTKDALPADANGIERIEPGEFWNGGPKDWEAAFGALHLDADAQLPALPGR